MEIILSAREIPDDLKHFFEPVGSAVQKKDLWTVPTEPYPESHFATFPTALVKPCILAGTSARGCCPKCGAPWERVVEPGTTRSWHDHKEDLAHGQRDESNDFKGQNFYRNYVPPETTGWRPACQHGEDPSEVRSPIPCTVLDPFGGSGTVGQVALELGRKAILIEINPKYVELARSRTFVTPGLQLA